ncbi:MAG: molybdopterin-dependent oxidoreductase [Nitrospirae bacterium]|nr:molybdopterin-dependent oxidoreductase [Nitrospirota bacterium]
MKNTRVVRTACPRDCFDACSILATVEKGKMVKIEGDAASPITRGHLCPKGEAYIPWVYHPERLTHPLKRTGARGEGKWEKISWEEALDLVTEKLRGLKEKYGSDSILYHWGTGTHFSLYYGILPFRFFNLMGGAMNLRGSLCANAGHSAVAFTYGESLGHDPEDIVNSKYIVFWGKNVTSTNIHHMPFIYEAVEKNGATLVTIDPRFTEIAAKSAIYLQPRIGTDGALALGMMNVIIREGLYDSEFVKNHTVGFDQLKKLVKEYPPERVMSITTLPKESIIGLARDYATIKPARIEVGMGLQHNSNGGQTFRAIASLVAISGNLGISGGGLGFPTSRFTYPRAHNLELKLTQMDKNKSTVPVVKAAEAILTGKPKPIKGLFVWAANPVNQNPDTGKMIRAMKSSNLEFSVVLDPFMTDTARLADLVLPSCTSFEQTDVGISYWQYYMQLQQKVIEPLEGSKTDLEIFRELAKRFGFEEYFSHSEEEFAELAINRKLDRSIVEHVTVQKLKEGPIRAKMPNVVWSDRKFPTPSGKVELYSERLISLGVNPLPIYEEPLESHVRTPKLAEKYPLSLISRHSRFSMHSMDYKNPLMKKVNPKPLLDIHPRDAEERGISNGDLVTVENDRGKVSVIARTTRAIKPGVVSLPQGWSLQDGCSNFLTADYLTDIGENASYFTCLVQVTKRKGEDVK